MVFRHDASPQQQQQQQSNGPTAAVIAHFVALGCALSLLGAVLPTPAAATVSFDNCTSHLIRGSHPSQLPPDDVSISLCKGGTFAIAYDKPMLNPQYSAWAVTARQVKANIPGRAGNFRQDDDMKALRIPHGNASSKCWSIEWNRGHLAPSRMLSSSEWGKYQTYYYSNVAPQWWAFNQQSWEQCEDAIFDVVGQRAKDPETMDEPFYIVTGVDYFDREGRGIVKNSSVAMPNFYYTAVCNPLRQQSFAYVGLNNGSNGGPFLFSYRTVRELELMFTSTSGVIFDDRTADGASLLCNTRSLDAMFWKMNRFDTISTFPASYGTDDKGTDGSGALPDALSMADIVPLTTLTKNQNVNTTNYTSAVAVDTFRIEFTGGDAAASYEWGRVTLPKNAAPEAYEANSGSHAFVRDAFLGTFRRAMRRGNADLADDDEGRNGREGLLKWPAHGYVMEATRIYTIDVVTSPLKVGNVVEPVAAAAARRKLSILTERSTLFAPAVAATTTEQRLVMEIAVHRFRSLGLPSSNTVSRNVTDGIAEALRAESFDHLLHYYEKVVGGSSARTANGAYRPVSVTILGSDVEAAPGPDEEDSRTTVDPSADGNGDGDSSEGDGHDGSSASSHTLIIGLCVSLTAVAAVAVAAIVLWRRRAVAASVRFDGKGGAASHELGSMGGAANPLSEC